MKITPSEASEMLRKSLRNISDKTRNMGAALQNSMQNAINSKKDVSVYSKASRELDEYGYEKYNIDDEVEIFISKVPERALFNDGEPVIVRANDQSFIGTSVTAPKTASILMDDGEPVRDVHELFSNVQTGSGSSQVISGHKGTVVDGEVHLTADDEVERDVSCSDIAAVMPAETVSMPAPAAVVSSDDSDVATAADSVVESEEDISIVQFEGDSDIVIMQPADDVQAPAVSADDSDDDYSWYDDDSDDDEFVREYEAVHGAGACPDFDVSADDAADEISVPESVPVEAGTEKSTGIMEVLEPAEAAAVSEPVAGASVVASISTFKPEPAEETQKIEGLYTEAEEATSAAETVDEVAAVSIPGLAKTSSEAVPAVNPLEPVAVIKGMDENGSSILPPMTEPVKRRPGTMRFRFHNGVLQNVDDKKEESEEGLRGPFDVTVGQTVSQSADTLRLPPVEIDDETDMMRITVPELDVDWDALSVGSTDDEIPEDGMEVLRFAPAPAPRVEVGDEVGDIMMMTVPGLDLPTAGFWEYEEIPEDGMEALCFQPEPVYDPSCIGIGVGLPAIAAAAPVSMIGAPVRIHALPRSAPVMQLTAAPEAIPEEEPATIPVRSPEVPVHAVSFGFGNGEHIGTVCFSF